MPCGPATRAFGEQNPVPAAPAAVAARAVLPVSAWYTGDCAAAPPPVTLAVEAVDMRGEKISEMVKGTPFRLKVTTDRKIHFVLLAVFATGQVEVVPTKQGGFVEAGNHTLAPENGGAFRITDILTGEEKANEYFILLASTEKFAAPVVVRSRHSRAPDCDEDRRYPIHRFVFDPDSKLDQSLLVRKVVALTIKAK
jgi:hypothetical protein